jgi:hypothetical protein
LLERLKSQSEEIALLKNQLSMMSGHISALEAEIAILEHPKNSSNSSRPPSHDPFRLKMTASLREKSGKKQGGQSGHEGNTLTFSDNPDAVIEHKSDYCNLCGGDLSGVEAIFAGKRQVIDIPPVVPIITEHQIFSRQCSCGHSQRSDYPPEAHSSVCYGKNLLGLTAYFHSRQYVPFDSDFPQSTIVHDCWKPSFKVNAGNHQICTAHLLRELKYLVQLYSDEWPANFTQLLKEALLLKKELTPLDYLYPIEKRKLLEVRLNKLLQQPVNGKHSKLVTIQNRMKEYRQFLFQFLYRNDVPPDNNASERAVRTFKVKQKVSGLFRSLEGAQAFARIRSVIDTAIKNGQNVWEGWLPSWRGLNSYK